LHLGCYQAFRKEFIGFVGDQYRGTSAVNCFHPHSAFRGNSQSSALSNGELMNAGVKPSRAPFTIDDGSWALVLAEATAEHFGKALARRDKTRVLAIGRVCTGEIELPCQIPDLLLFQAPDREQRALQLSISQPGKKVRLVFVPILGSQQYSSVNRVIYDACVVSGGHPSGAQSARTVQQEAPLDPLVAEKARVGSSATGKLLPARAQNKIVKLFLPAHDVVGNSQSCRHFPRLGHAFQAATCPSNVLMARV
jgi:hypothetical protein